MSPWYYYYNYINGKSHYDIISLAVNYSILCMLILLWIMNCCWWDNSQLQSHIQDMITRTKKLCIPTNYYSVGNYLNTLLLPLFLEHRRSWSFKTLVWCRLVLNLWSVPYMKMLQAQIIYDMFLRVANSVFFFHLWSSFISFISFFVLLLRLENIVFNVKFNRLKFHPWSRFFYCY